MPALVHPRTRRTRRRPQRDVPAPPRPAGDKKQVALRLGAGLVLIWGVITLLGLLLTHVIGPGPLHRADLGVDKFFAAHRSRVWNDVTYVGTNIAQTETVIGITIVAVALLRWRLGRWYEAGVLVTTIVGELVIFLCVTLVVHRPRPPVHRLDVAPETSSFPSGHTAAATALYGCLIVLLIWLSRPRARPAVRAAVAVLACLPVVVGLSRLYRGMHYPSDVICGALTGGLWLLVVTTTLMRRQPAGRPRRLLGAAAARPRAGILRR